MADLFHDRLLVARIKAGISQSELAALASIAPAQISRYEQGKNTPRPHVMGKLAEALGVRLRWLEQGEEPMVEATGRRNTVTLAFTPSEYEEIEAAAKEMGLPVQEAMIKMLREEASKLINTQLGGDFLEPATDEESLFKIKASLEELQKRVDELSRK